MSILCAQQPVERMIYCFYCIRMHMHGVHSNVSVMLSWAYYCINCVEKFPLQFCFTLS